MYDSPIGELIDSYKPGVADALKWAAKLGADNFQMYAVKGAYAPENLTVKKRAELLNTIKSHGLRVSALCGDLEHGFDKKELNPGFIEISKNH